MDPAESPFADAPAPWHCEGECFWLFGYARGGTYPPPVAFNTLEGASSYADPETSGAFKGGLMFVMIVRYTSSPVGPYDELMYVPGQFAVPPNKSAANRITRIYVSTKESVYNGRKNWNIPKHVAHFTFVPSGAASASPSALPYSRIAVAPPDAPEDPFFVLDLAPTLLLGRGVLPFNSRFVPFSSRIACPPLPQSERWKEDACVGTDRWVALTPGMSGKAGFFSAKGGLPGGAFADNVGFPDVRPFSTAMWLREFKLEFPVGDVLGKKDE